MAVPATSKAFGTRAVDAVGNATAWVTRTVCLS